MRGLRVPKCEGTKIILLGELKYLSKGGGWGGEEGERGMALGRKRKREKERKREREKERKRDRETERKGRQGKASQVKTTLERARVT